MLDPEAVILKGGSYVLSLIWVARIIVHELRKLMIELRRRPRLRLRSSRGRLP